MAILSDPSVTATPDKRDHIVEHLLVDHGFSETFMHLLADPAHWAFELLVSVVFLGAETIIFWPLIRRFRHHHRDDDDDIASLKLAVVELRAALNAASTNTVAVGCRRDGIASPDIVMIERDEVGAVAGVGAE